MTDQNSAGPTQEPFGIDEQPVPSTPSDNDRLFAGLAYASQILVPAVFPVVLLLSNDTQKKPFLRFHAVQSLGVLIASIAFYLAATVVYSLLTALIPPLGCILWLLFLVPAGAGLYCGYEAFRGRYLEIPWLTQFMRDNRWL